jgi:hypothetical protein
MKMRYEKRIILYDLFCSSDRYDFILFLFVSFECGGESVFFIFINKYECIIIITNKEIKLFFMKFDEIK